MREDLYSNLWIIVTCFGVALLLFKIILDLIPKKIKWSLYIKTGYGVVYWLLFLFLLNIPTTTIHYYNLVPFEGGKYYHLYEQEEYDLKSIVFQYEKDGVVMPYYLTSVSYTIANDDNDIFINEEEGDAFRLSKMSNNDFINHPVIIVTENSSLLKSLFLEPIRGSYHEVNEKEFDEIIAFVKEIIEE